MDINQHSDHTEKKFGLRCQDIHKWIDGYFDSQGFHEFLEKTNRASFNPFEHRKHRHCREALPEALSEFQNKYTPDQIQKVFLTHLEDDYEGYIPSRVDFSDTEFLKKYHRNPLKTAPLHEDILTHQERAKYFLKYEAKKKATQQRENWVFNFRIVLPSILSIFIFLSFIFLYIVPTIGEVLLNKKKEMIQELANTASSVIHFYIDLEKQGDLSRTEAQKIAIAELRKMRYGFMAKDYYWITDMHPFMIMHPYRPELEGQDLTNYRDKKDKSGKTLFKDAVDLVQLQGHGYLTYRWQWMDEENTSALKLSYVLKIDDWEWILGTGIYINDIEVELNTINTELLTVSLVLSTLLLLLLLFMVAQSRQMENRRRNAESGLIEAKERYRSLVESSAEAYLLVIDDRIIFSNRKIQQLLGLEEQELSEKPLAELFDLQDLPASIFTNPETENFPVSLKIDGQLSLSVTLKVSKVFFEGANGFLLTIREIQKLANTLFLQNKPLQYEEILERMSNAKTVSQVLFLFHNIPSTLFLTEEFKSNPLMVREKINQSFLILQRKIMDLLLVQRDQPPRPFALINLGSNGRGEITFFSDQDNALIIEDQEEVITDQQIRYFLDLGHEFCRIMNLAGFAYCPGGIMALNSQWCLPTSQWKLKIQKWLREPNHEALVNLNILGDAAFVYGKESLFKEFKKEFLNSLNGFPLVLSGLASKAVHSKLPINLMNQLQPERLHGEKGINLKECLGALEISVRLYALKNQIMTSSTVERLKTLLSRDLLNASSQESLVEAFQVLWKLRNSAQFHSHQALRKVGDTLPSDDLDNLEKKQLLSALVAIRNFQQKIDFEFLGNLGV